MSKSILIGNKIKPTQKATRTEHIFGVPYVFANRNNDGHFIAEVSDPHAAELMLSQPDHFYPYPPNQPRITRGADDDAETERRLKEIQEKAKAEALAAEQAAAAEKAAAEQAALAAAEAAKGAAGNAELADAVAGADPAIVDEAKKFLEGDVKKMSAAVQKVSSLAVVKVAVAMETGGQNRAPVLKVLNDVLSLAAGAGQ